MIISKNNIRKANIKVNNQMIERVRHATFLETIINEDWNLTPQLEGVQPIATFDEMNRLFKSPDQTITTEMRSNAS